MRDLKIHLKACDQRTMWTNMMQNAWWLNVWVHLAVEIMSMTIPCTTKLFPDSTPRKGVFGVREIKTENSLPPIRKAAEETSPKLALYKETPPLLARSHWKEQRSHKPPPASPKQPTQPTLGRSLLQMIWIPV
jgi:hypothetical protein